MERGSKRLEDDEISIIEKKRKVQASRFSREREGMFKQTDSVMEENNDMNTELSGPQIHVSEAEDQNIIRSSSSKRGSKNMHKTPHFYEKQKTVKTEGDKEKEMNINLSHTIPMAISFKKQKQADLHGEQRKHRIFPEVKQIKFHLPDLSQYYFKPKTENEISKVKQEQSSSSLNNNRNMNISASTFLGFNQGDKGNKKRQALGQFEKEKQRERALTVSIGKEKNLNEKWDIGKFKNIEERSKQREKVEEKEKEKEGGSKSLQIKLVYIILLAFFLVMALIIRNIL